MDPGYDYLLRDDFLGNNINVIGNDNLGMEDEIEDFDEYHIHDIYPLPYTAKDLEYNDENSKLTSSDIKLTREQFDVCNAFLNGDCVNLYIGGRAGSGKTTCLNYCIDKMAAYYQRNPYYDRHEEQSLDNNNEVDPIDMRMPLWKTKVAVTGTTGVSAVAINGRTIHSFLGIDERKPDVRSMISSLGIERITEIMSIDVLIIEEISMLRSTLFCLVDVILREIKSRYNHLPFGGTRLLIFGDFNQLPPVIIEGNRYKQTEVTDDKEYNNLLLKESYKQIYAFESQVWKENITDMIELKVIMRQGLIQGDNLSEEEMKYNRGQKLFIKFCDQLREGRMDRETVKMIILPRLLMKKNTQTYKKSIEPDDIGDDTTAIFYTNEQVNELNALMESKIKTDGNVYESIDRNSGIEAIDILNDRGCNLQKRVVLQLGTKVMLLRNLSTDKGFVNGCIGWVTSFDERTRIPKVYFNTKENKANPLVYPYHEKNVDEIVKYISQFDDYADYINYESYTYLDRSTKKFVAFRVQVPLRSCYAVTTQKSQGSTLHKTLIIPTSMNAHEGLLYTAFTRNTKYNGFTIYDSSFVEKYYSANNHHDRNEAINYLCDVVMKPKVSPNVIVFNRILNEHTIAFFQRKQERDNLNMNIN